MSMLVGTQLEKSPSLSLNGLSGHSAPANPTLSPKVVHASPVGFSTLCLDDEPALLRESYRLRYQVYCLERRFLPASDNPDGLETDGFDRFAQHFGTIDGAGRLVGTARFVFPSILGLPLFRHCSVFPDETELYLSHRGVVEVSRLCVGRRDRPNGYGHLGVPGLATTPDDPAHSRKDAVVFSLYRELYQASKRAGLTHWVVATETSLQRVLSQFGFPFRAIGPEVDYFGPVAPYLMDLSAFDQVILNRTIARLDGFLDGLEPPHRPRPRVVSMTQQRSAFGPTRLDR